MGGIMSRRVSGLSIVTVVLMVTLSALAQKTLTASEAKDHIGEQATVCGKVLSTRYAESSRGRPTFLNFDQPYPNQVFTLLIWGSDRSKFGDPEMSYRGKRICVTGKISDYKGVPEIVANAPSQVKTQ
jgi:DNA/RNA endonuclease YhcR with UshA esterase domain